MRRRVLTVVLVNDNVTYLSGHGSRELIIEIRGGRPPLWSSIGRAWAVAPKTARDVIAAAEARGWDIAITRDDPLPAAMGVLW